MAKTEEDRLATAVSLSLTTAATALEFVLQPETYPVWLAWQRTQIAHLIQDEMEIVAPSPEEMKAMLPILFALCAKLAPQYLLNRANHLAKKTMHRE